MPRQPLTAIHLGAGALTIPRYIETTRPGSRQQVIELEPALWDLVRESLPLPRGASIRVRIGDARGGLGRLPAGLVGAADLVVSDVYSGAQTPADIQSRQGTYRLIVPTRSTESDEQIVFPASAEPLPPLRVYRLEAKPMAGPGEVRLSSLALWTAQELDRIEVDALAGQRGRDRRQNAGAVFHHEPEVIRAGGRRDHPGRRPLLAVIAFPLRQRKEVRDHRHRGCRAAGAGAAETILAAVMPADRHPLSPVNVVPLIILRVYILFLLRVA